MKKAVLYIAPEYYWDAQALVLFDEEGAITKIVSINKFYKVRGNWFEIFTTLGGSGSGFSPGDLERKIYIGDREFDTIKVSGEQLTNLKNNKIVP